MPNIPAKKRKPFYIRKRGTETFFNPRAGVEIDSGLDFNGKRGCVVYFHYRDTPAFRNLVTARWLRSWIEQQPTDIEVLNKWLRGCERLARQAERMNDSWAEAGKPSEGPELYKLIHRKNEVNAKLKTQKG